MPRQYPLPPPLRITTPCFPFTWLVTTAASGCSSRYLHYLGGGQGRQLQDFRLQAFKNKGFRPHITNEFHLNRSHISRSAILALSLATSQAVSAQQAVPLKGYVGIGAGQTSFGYDSEQCTSDTGLPCDLETSDRSMKIYGGIGLGQQAALEITYYDLGSLEGTAGPVSLEEEQTALSVAVLGIAPFNEQVGGFFKIGLFSSDLEATATGPGGSVTMSDSSRKFLLGLGLNANFNSNVGLRLEYEHLVEAGDGESDIGVATASLRLMF